MVHPENSRKGSPLVSVIVPGYNYAHLLPETIRCLQTQTLTDWECIVLDDGSTDNTQEVATQMASQDPRVRYMQLQHGGVSAARNAGLRVASGKYLQFLDADDLLEDQKLEQHVRWLESHPEVDLVYGSARFFSHENPQERRYRIAGDDEPWIPEVSGGRQEVLPTLIRENIMPINCPMFRASAAAEVGFFDESLSTMEDWDYWLRWTLHDRVIHFCDLAGTLALIRYHPTSASTNYRRMMSGYVSVRHKLKASVHEPDLAQFNEEKLRFLEECLVRIDRLMSELAVLIPETSRFILADDGQLHFMGANSPLAMPFLEHEGKFWGSPTDDETAIRELERLRLAGAEFIAFAWPAFWWLDYYTGFAQHLRSNFPCLIENDHLIVFHLQNPH